MYVHILNTTIAVSTHVCTYPLHNYCSKYTCTYPYTTIAVSTPTCTYPYTTIVVSTPA